MLSKTAQNYTNSLSKRSLDQAIAIALIEKPNATDDEMAPRFSLSRAQFNRRKNSNNVQKIIGDYLRGHMKCLKALGANAMKKIQEHIEHPDPRISLAACALTVRMLTVKSDTIFVDETEAKADDVVVYKTRWGSNVETTR